MAHMKDKLRHDEDIFIGDDDNFSLMNLYRYGILYYDTRYFFKCKVPMAQGLVGGMTDFRTTEHIKKANRHLLKKYGKYVQGLRRTI